jgi:hypothetical protein
MEDVNERWRVEFSWFVLIWQQNKPKSSKRFLNEEKKSQTSQAIMKTQLAVVILTFHFSQQEICSLDTTGCNCKPETWKFKKNSIASTDILYLIIFLKMHQRSISTLYPWTAEYIEDWLILFKVCSFQGLMTTMNTQQKETDFFDVKDIYYCSTSRMKNISKTNCQFPQSRTSCENWSSTFCW